MIRARSRSRAVLLLLLAIGCDEQTRDTGASGASGAAGRAAAGGSQGASGAAGNAAAGAFGTGGASGSAGTGASNADGSVGNSGAGGTNGAGATTGMDSSAGAGGMGGTAGASGSSGRGGSSGSGGSSGTSGASGSSGAGGTGGVGGTGGRSSSTFRNPLNTSHGSDPWMLYHDGQYYLAATTWNTTLTMKSGATIQRLKEATPRVIWDGAADSSARRYNMWAPEFHLLDGPNGRRWYLYYTAGDGASDFSTQRLHVLESAGTDPFGPYTYRATLFPSTWAIDGSVLRVGTNLYVMFSSHQGEQSIFIAPLSNPWTVSGARVLLSQPNLSWEREGDFPVNEGPEPLYKDGRIFVVYSASHCASPGYKLGLLELTGSNPLAQTSWKKFQSPVFQQAPGIFGPAHNGFFKSPDGTEDWIVYHANSNAADGCWTRRTTRAQRFDWNADGTPNFGTPLPLSTDVRAPSGE